MKVSLGLVEVKGLALAINTADAMSKCAAINLVDVETAKGGGWMTIKVTGDVAAVQAAVSTGAALAEKCNGLVSQKVLSRPDTKLLQSIIPSPKASRPEETETSEQEAAEDDSEKAEPEAPVTEPEIAESEEEIQEDEESSEEEQQPTCNLCHDPACPRKKGEPHIDCIHEGENK